jgi:hypothetical protein
MSSRMTSSSGDDDHGRHRRIRNENDDTTNTSPSVAISESIYNTNNHILDDNYSTILCRGVIYSRSIRSSYVIIHIVTIPITNHSADFIPEFHTKTNDIVETSASQGSHL